MSLTRTPKLLEAKKFAEEATKTIAKATSRVALVTTTLHANDKLSQAIVDELCKAAERELIVTVCADAYTYTEPKEFILRSPRKHPERAYKAIKMERHLKKSGVDFHWLGRTSNFGFAGRTHSKWLIVDDTVFSFGGVNIDKASFENTDYMWKIEKNPILADALFAQHLRLLKADRAGHATKSKSVEIDQKTNLLIDGGLIGDSVIYRRACSLANKADSIILVSQYCPTGKLNRILKRKNTTLYFNHWRQASWMNKLLIQFGMVFTRRRTMYQQKNYLHAKFIIFTMPGNKKIAITGSHNFMFSSVLIGTREVAIETSDNAYIKQLERFLDLNIR